MWGMVWDQVRVHEAYPLGMRSFDAFARPVQEFQVKTAIGGYISIGSLCLVLALFFAELRYFLTPEAKDEMLIDQNQDRKYLNISLDISFSSLPCAALSLNLMDPKGANVMHVAHEIYKQRRSKTGQPLGKPIRDSLQNVASTPAQLLAASLPEKVAAQSNHSTRSLRCASCFQSHIDEDDCCPTCKDVQASFLSRGWDDRPDGYIFGRLTSTSHLFFCWLNSCHSCCATCHGVCLGQGIIDPPWIPVASQSKVKSHKHVAAICGPWSLGGPSPKQHHRISQN